MPAGILEPWHLVLILLIAIVVFGPSRIGDIGGSLGRGIREFKQSINTDEPLATSKPDEKASKTDKADKPKATVNGTEAAAAAEVKAQADSDRANDLFAHSAIAMKEVLNADSALTQAKAAVAAATRGDS